MKSKIDKNYLLWLTGTVVIAIFSNAIWEFLVKPALLSVQNGILNLTTLGIRSFKDAIYAEIAKGHHDRASDELLFLFVALMIGVVAFINSTHFERLGRIRKKHKELAKSLDRLQQTSGTDEPLHTIESIKTTLVSTERNQVILRRLALLFAGLALFFAISTITMAAKIKYISSAVTYYDQLIKIATPYITDSQRKLIDSQFSQIKKEEDFDRIVTHLNSIAISNSQTVPAFKVW
ncbi:MAG: hypothetical protein NT179_06265 [Nitrospirae bacterium]|nr:hypothetical protein [Nitrospirota bacterium]